MKKLFAKIKKRGAVEPAAPQEKPDVGRESLTTPLSSKNAERKLPPELPLFFMVSHLEDDGPVRLDRVKLGVCEVMGLEIDEPKLGAFAGALNACDFPVQLLIRQHPPRLGGLRDKLSGGTAGQSSAADRGRVEVASQAPDRPGDPRRHPRPALLRHHRVRPVRRAAGPAGAGRAVRPPPERQASADVSCIRCPRRHAWRL